MWSPAMGWSNQTEGMTMRELTSLDTQAVSAGLVPLLVVLGFVWYEAPNIESAVNGFFDSMLEHQ